MNIAEALLKDIQALESMEDPVHILSLHACRYSGTSDCSGCPLNAGHMEGGCCAGLLRAARTHYDMFRSGRCGKNALARRYATLADWMKRKFFNEVVLEPVPFLPTCKWANTKGSCTWCTNIKSIKYFNGPCSKRCEGAEK